MNVAPIAQSGLQSAFKRFDESAQRTVRSGRKDSDVDLAAEIVERDGAQRSAQANIAVLRTHDEMQGRILDIKA